MSRPRYSGFSKAHHKHTLSEANHTVTYAVKTSSTGSYLTALQLAWSATQVNYLKVTGSDTGSPGTVTLEAVGSDAAINLVLIAKGGGSVTGIGAVSGTTGDTFTVASGESDGKFAIAVNTTGSNHTVTLKAPVTTQTMTLTLPDVSSDTVCAIAATQTLTNKTLTTPTIGSFTNATHDHSDAAGGGAVSADADSTGTTNVSYTVNSDASDGKIVLSVTAGGTDNSVTLTNTATTGDITITLPDVTSTLAALGIAQSFTKVQTIAVTDAGTNTVTDVLVLNHIGGTVAASFGTGISVWAEDTDNASGEEVLSIDAVFTSVSSGAEYSDVNISTMLNGTVTQALSLDASAGELVVGNDATYAAGFDSIRIWPVTAAKGSILIVANANTGDDTITVTGGNTGGDITVTLPIKTTTLLGKDITGQAGYLQLDGSVSGGVKIAPIATGTAVTTLQNSNQSAVTITLPAVTGTLIVASAATTFTATQTIQKDDTSNGAVDGLVLIHSSSDNNATAADAISLSLHLENATGTSTVEEWGRLDMVSTTITNGAENGDFVFNQMTAGTLAETLRLVAASSTTVSDYMQFTGNTTEANGVVEVARFKTSMNTVASGFGTKVGFWLGNDGGTNEEHASIQVITGAADGTEDTDIVWSTMLDGTVTEALRLDASDNSLTLGKDTSLVTKLRIHPATSNKGTLIVAAADNTSDDDLTVTNVAQGGANTAQIPNIGAGATDQFVMEDVSQILTNKTIDGDNNTIQDLSFTSPKNMTYASNIGKGIPFIISAEFTAAGTFNYTVDNGSSDLQVLNAWGFKKTAAGIHVDDQIDIKNSGTTNNIFATEELNGVADGDFFQFSGLDDAEDVVADGNILRVTAGENAANGCDSLVHILCLWV